MKKGCHKKVQCFHSLIDNEERFCLRKKGFSHEIRIKHTVAVATHYFHYYFNQTKGEKIIKKSLWADSEELKISLKELCALTWLSMVVPLMC